MKLLIISVKDLAVQAFQPVNTVRAKGEAIRGFMDAVNNPQAKQIHEHPQDFDLYLVGHFDDQTGELTTLDPIVLLMRGTDAKQTRQ